MTCELDRKMKMIVALKNKREELNLLASKFMRPDNDPIDQEYPEYVNFQIKNTLLSEDDVFKKYIAYIHEMTNLDSNIEDLEAGRTTPEEIIMERLSRDV